MKQTKPRIKRIRIKRIRIKRECFKNNREWGYLLYQLGIPEEQWDKAGTVSIRADLFCDVSIPEEA